MSRRASRAAVLLAAAAVALAGCTSGGSSKGSAASPPSSAAVSSSPVAGSSTGATVPSGSRTSSRTSSAQPAPVVHQKLTNFRIADVTFVGGDEWALGTATCLNGSGAACAAMEHSGDGGRTWQSAAIPRSAVVQRTPEGGPSGSCADPCLQHVRFASAKVGYLFSGRTDAGSPKPAFFMTTDGGRTWARQQGGAEALEASHGTVVRVSDQGDCPPGCAFRVQTAQVGSTTWTTRTLPGPFPLGVRAELGRAAGAAYVVSFGNPAGGGERETSVLWTSTNDGRSWTNRGEPCPHRTTEYDTAALTTAPDGSATLLCRQRAAKTGQFVTTTTDAGRTFRTGSRTALGSALVTGFGAASPRIVLVSAADTFRSTDGGQRFARLAANAGSSPGNPVYIGFASASVGHAVSSDRRTLWTTQDAGATWTAHRFA